MIPLVETSDSLFARILFLSWARNRFLAFDFDLDLDLDLLRERDLDLERDLDSLTAC